MHGLSVSVLHGGSNIGQASPRTTIKCMFRERMLFCSSTVHHNYTEKAPNTWHPKEHKIQGAPTINTNDSQQAQLTDQAPGTIERAAQGSSRITPSIAAAVHASSTATSRHHHAHAAGSSPDPLSQRSPLRSAGGTSLSTTQTPPAPAGTSGTPLPGGP